MVVRTDGELQREITKTVDLAQRMKHECVGIIHSFTWLIDCSDLSSGPQPDSLPSPQVATMPKVLPSPHLSWHIAPVFSDLCDHHSIPTLLLRISFSEIGLILKENIIIFLSFFFFLSVYI